GKEGVTSEGHVPDRPSWGAENLQRHMSLCVVSFLVWCHSKSLASLQYSSSGTSISIVFHATKGKQWETRGEHRPGKLGLLHVRFSPWSGSDFSGLHEVR